MYSFLKHIIKDLFIQNYRKLHHRLVFLLILKYRFDVSSFVAKCLNKVLKCICISNSSLVSFLFILLNSIYFYLFMMNLKFHCHSYSPLYTMIFLGILNLIFFLLTLHRRVGMKMHTPQIKIISNFASDQSIVICRSWQKNRYM